MKPLNRFLLPTFVLLLSLLNLPAGAAVSSEGTTRDLDGTEITYSYEDGSTYNVRYTPEGVMYRFVSGEAGNKWWGPFPFKAFKTPAGEYFLGWYEKGYGDQITHLVDLKNKTLYGSGIIVKKDGVVEHFQKAKISEIRKY